MFDVRVEVIFETQNLKSTISKFLKMNFMKPVQHMALGLLRKAASGLL